MFTIQRGVVQSNFKAVSCRKVCVRSLPNHYASKKTRISLEDVQSAIQEALEVSKTHTDTKYIAAQWDVAHEVFVHYARQEKYLAEHRTEYDALECYCEQDQSSLECREYDL
jgi:hypothetical protein